MAAVEIEDDERTASDASVDGGGDARMNLRREEESPLSKASAKEIIRHSDAEAERAALRDAADAAAALAAALGPPQVTRGGAVKPNPYEAAASEAKSKPRDSQARDALNMPPPAPKDREKRGPKHASPEKRAKLEGPGLAAPPTFGAGIGGAPAAPYVPPGPQPGAGVGHIPEVPTPLSRPGPQFFHMDPPQAPSWVHELRDLFQAGQQDLMKEVKLQGRSLDQVTGQLQALDKRQEDMTHQQSRSQSRLDEMEAEMRDLREARSVSPAPNRVPGNPQDMSPRSTAAGSSMPGKPIVDDLQLVVGGWREAKKTEVEAEVRRLFDAIDAGALLQDIHVPFVRTNFARVELLFTSTKLQERRRIQTLVLTHLKKHLEKEPFSTIAKQTSCRLWVTRNRSKEERAKIRALVAMKEYCSKHVNPMFIDLDWRGKLWVRSEQILFFAHTKRPHHASLMLNDSRGDESGWWVDLQVLSRVLARSQKDIESDLLE